ncbi:MAG TPA: glycosyltransferase family 39 protein [Solirubrobacterales bacterium]|nr:glycosyltransferase family 39 protein [Solirubrobacterales bacterium]
MTGLAARNGGRAGLAALVAIVLLGLALRADYAWEGRAPVYDALAYAKIAERLSEGDGFTLGESATQPASNYSPGLPLLAGGIYELTGGVHERSARLVLALLGSLAVAFTYLIGRRLSGPAAGLIGAAAIAIYPALLEYQGMLMGEPLAATLLSGAVLAMLWASGQGPAPRRAGPVAAALPHVLGRKASSAMGDPRHRATHARWLVPGLLLGALVLVRPEYLGISLLVAVVVLAWGRPQWRSGFANAAILLVGVLLVVVPWTVRNEVVLDRFVPVSTGGGQVLFAGSYMPSGGDPERVGEEVLERHPGLARQLPPDSRLEEILAALAAQRYPGLESDEALARMGRERLWDDVSERPLQYVGFVAEKLANAWGHGPREVMEKPGWELLHWALLGFALLGFAVLVHRHPREALLLGALLVAVSAIVGLLVASPRRVLVAMPLVASLAGVGAAWAWEKLGERGRSAGATRPRSA